MRRPRLSKREMRRRLALFDESGLWYDRIIPHIEKLAKIGEKAAENQVKIVNYIETIEDRLNKIRDTQLRQKKDGTRDRSRP